MTENFSITTLLTNEYAYWNKTAPDAKINSRWWVTSGTLYAKDGQGYSGVPDKTASALMDATSSKGNNSSALRFFSKEPFGDTTLSFNYTLLGLSSALTAQSYDGIHVFIRRKDENNTYYISVSRRDQTIVIKKKLAGTYYDLTEYKQSYTPIGKAQFVKITCTTDSKGVTITLYINGTPRLTCLDSKDIFTVGSVGFRGDNAEFLLDDIKINE